MPQQQGGYGAQVPFGNFINDPTAQLGLNLSKNAMDAGQQYMEQNVRNPRLCSTYSDVPQAVLIRSSKANFCTHSSAAFSPSPR